MTKAEFLARMERDLDEDIKIRCFAITGTCEKGTVLNSGIGGKPMDIVKFVIRVLKSAANRLDTDPKFFAGAIAAMLEIGGEEKSIEVDVSAVEAAAGKREAEDDDDE